jgi:hypothetical protein
MTLPATSSFCENDLRTSITLLSASLKYSGISIRLVLEASNVRSEWSEIFDS